MSNQNEFKPHEPFDDRDDEINLGQIIGFFINNWKSLGLGAVAGLVLGLGATVAFGEYKAQMILDNNGTNKSMDFMSWRVLETKLPLLAAQIVESRIVKPDEDQFGRLSRSDWWGKNVVPTYSLSKVDTKNLAAICKNLQDSEGTSILNLKVTNSDNSRENAEKNLITSVNFIRTGSAYLMLKTVIDGYDFSLQTTESDLQRKITAMEIELNFMNQKAKNLEGLGRRFPSNTNFTSSQVIDPKDSGAKYLPISTQLVAVNTDINNVNESLVRMHNQLAQQKIMREFLDRASPIVASQIDGLMLADKLLAIEGELRKKLDAKDINQHQVVDNIRAELVALRTRFGRQLEISQITTTRASFLIPAFAGLFSGIFLTFLALIGRHFWSGLRVQQSRPSVQAIPIMELKHKSN